MNQVEFTTSEGRVINYGCKFYINGEELSRVTKAVFTLSPQSFPCLTIEQIECDEMGRPLIEYDENDQHVGIKRSTRRFIGSFELKIDGHECLQ